MSNRVPQTQYLTTNPRLAAVARGLTSHARFIEHLQVVAPLHLEPLAQGSLSLSFRDNHASGFQLTVWQDGSTTRWSLAAGNLRTFSGQVFPVALESGTLTGDRKFWLEHTVYNNGDPDLVEVVDGADDWPEADYQTDSLPGSPVCTPPTLEGYSKLIVPIAEVDYSGGAVTQYVGGDIWLPTGPTLLCPKVIAQYWDSDALKAVIMTETMVRGIVIAASGPTCETVFGTGPCPEET